MVPSVDDRLSHLRREIEQVDPNQADELLQSGAVAIDVREPEELESGTIAGAKCLPRGYMEFRIARLCPTATTPIIVICATGARSLLAAASLKQLGYSRVVSLAGGIDRWRSAGKPIAEAKVLTLAEQRRYSRHLRIPEVGTEGQLKLKSARVLLIGCGGLGSPSALYLAAAGVGRITLVDFDVVDETNLQRQILFKEQDVGKLKAHSAAKSLEQINSTIEVVAMVERVDEHNLLELVQMHDVVVDGTDNFTARFLINDACVRAKKPLVHGSVYRFDGQVAVFRNRDNEDACYRCLYPEAPPAELAPSCMEAGVLGVLPGVVGTLQAVECLKIILGLGDPLVGKLLTYDALDSTFATLGVEQSPNCQCRQLHRPQRQV